MQHSNDCENQQHETDLSVPIHTIYVTPIEEFMLEKVKEYFGQFGTVDDIRLHDNGYGFVQFKETHDAQAVLLIDSHQIANRSVDVKAGHPWHQPSHILNALNDDCFRRLFLYLDVKSLKNAADVCVRFNQYAREAFAKKYRKKTLDLCTNIPEFEFERIFRNFGEFITSLSLTKFSEDKIEDKFILPLLKFCIPKLKKLKTNGFRFAFGKNMVENLRPIWSKLERLHLVNVDFKNADMKSLLSECMQLKKLKLSWCDFGKEEIINQKFDEIEEAQFNNNFGLSCKDLNCFIDQNPSLKKVTIFGTPIDLTIIRTIGERLLDLEELYLKDFIGSDYVLLNNLLFLSQLNCLNILILQYPRFSIAPLMKNLASNNVPIEHLQIDNGVIDGDAIGSISNLKTIRILRFSDCYGKVTDENLIQLAKELPELQELSFYENNHILDFDRTVDFLSLTTIGLKEMLTHAHKLTFLQLNHIHVISNRL